MHLHENLLPPLRDFQNAALNLFEKTQALLVIAPTGAGKSRIYEEILLNSKKRAVLLSPLIALGQQQTVRLNSLGIKAYCWMGNVESPPSQTQVIVTSPERLGPFLTPEILIVDECHCAFEWGKSFRPSYENVFLFIHSRPTLKVLFLTATLKRSQIHELEMRIERPLAQIGKTELPKNICIEAYRCSWKERFAWLQTFLRHQESSGLIFVNTREMTERIARAVNPVDSRVYPYHAGLSVEEKALTYKRIQTEKRCVIVATTAFGLGMDVTTLRWCIVFQAPLSLFDLTQKIGRIGRDRKKAFAKILWSDEDFTLNEWAVRSPEAGRELLALSHWFRLEGCRTQALQDYFAEEQTNSTHCGNCNGCFANGYFSGYLNQA